MNAGGYQLCPFQSSWDEHGYTVSIKTNMTINTQEDWAVEAAK